MDRTLETKLVKRALAEAGINAEVSHGHGTAYGWLHVNVGSPDQFTHPRTEWCGCPQCQEANKRIIAISNRALTIALQVTGRQGEYDGRILTMTQKGWNKKNHCTVEIVQAVEPTAPELTPMETEPYGEHDPILQPDDYEPPMATELYGGE